MEVPKMESLTMTICEITKLIPLMFTIRNYIGYALNPYTLTLRYGWLYNTKSFLESLKPLWPYMDIKLVETLFLHIQVHINCLKPFHWLGIKTNIKNQTTFGYDFMHIQLLNMFIFTLLHIIGQHKYLLVLVGY